MKRHRIATGVLVALLMVGAGLAVWNRSASAAPRSDEVDVYMCDGKTKISVKPGTTQEAGQQTADSLMAQWRRNHPDRQWETDVRRSHPHIKKPFDNRYLLEGGQREGHTYGNFTAKDIELWERETTKMVLEGARVFHSGDELKSTIAVSCDMCHPDASNTHPETYPKFQVQLGRVALLRDMINWCLEHPVRAKPLSPDDPRMRAMEAYLTSERQGTPLQYGKH